MKTQTTYRHSKIAVTLLAALLVMALLSSCTAPAPEGPGGAIGDAELNDAPAVLVDDEIDAATKKYYDYFRENNEVRVILSGESTEFTDDAMAVFAVFNLENPDFENGNSKAEFNAITEKYFGRKISNFNTGSIIEDPATGRIKPTGWSYDSGVYMILKDLINNADGTKTADFYVLNVSDGVFSAMWENDDIENADEVKRKLLSGDIEKYKEYGVKVDVIRMAFEEKTDEDGEMYLKYLSVESVEKDVEEIVPYKGSSN